MEPAPIVLFVYNRPRHTEQTLHALEQNELAKDSILYIYADGPKENASQEVLAKIKETRTILRKKQWCKEIHILESQTNKGLANSVIEGVTQIINRYAKVIVMEDDLITSKGFLKYMNEGLIRFLNEEKVMEISGYCLPANKIKKNNSSFFSPLTSSWGWATWKRAWDKFDTNSIGYEKLKSDKQLEKKFNLDNSYQCSQMLINQMESDKIDSWVIRWWWSVFNQDGVTLFPDKSLVKNIGFGTESTHTKGEDPFQLKNFDPNYYINKFPDNVVINDEYFEQIKLFLRNNLSTSNLQKKEGIYTFFKRFINKFRRILTRK